MGIGGAWHCKQACVVTPCRSLMKCTVLIKHLRRVHREFEQDVAELQFLQLPSASTQLGLPLLPLELILYIMHYMVVLSLSHIILSGRQWIG